MQISSILEESKVGSRASYFSGRGATLSDLNSTKLLAMQDLIKKHHGEDAAKSFVDLVQSMENLNATDFINNCYLFERSGFDWTQKAAPKNGIEVIKNEDGEYDYTHGMLSIAAAMQSNDRDDTEAIKREFLRKNGIMPDYSKPSDGRKRKRFLL